MRPPTLLFLSLFILFTPACHSPPDCSTFVACGGNLIGAWQIAGSCVQPSTTPCGATNSVAQSYGGTLTINPDDSYQLDANVTISGSTTVPRACLGADPPTGCSSLDNSDNGVTTSCSGSPQRQCTCNVSAPSASASETGTLTIGASQVTFAPDGSMSTYGGGYCVNGNELRIQLQNSLGGFLVVLTK